MERISLGIKKSLRFQNSFFAKGSSIGGIIKKVSGTVTDTTDATQSDEVLKGNFISLS